MKTLIRKYQDPIAVHKDYVDVLLRLAGYRLSDLHVTILAYSSVRKALTPETKKEIALKFNTSIQVISNAITKLRKLKLLLKNNINPKLKPENDYKSTLTIHFGYVPDKQKPKVQVPNTAKVEENPVVVS